MSEDAITATSLVEKIAEKYRQHNVNAIDIGGIVSSLANEHGYTLDSIRRRLREEFGVMIHSNGTLSKWRSVYDTYIRKWGLTITEISHYEIGKLYMIRDVFEPSTADIWFDRMNTMTEGELMSEVGEAGVEGRKHFSVPLSVAGLMERARAALSQSAVGSAGNLSSTAYQEIVAQLVIEMGDERRREIYDALHGEQRE